MTLKLLGFLFFICFFQATICTWSTPIRLSAENRDCGYPEMYTDPATHITHVIWRDRADGNNNLSYTQVKADRTVIPSKYLETERSTQYSRIVGEGDGKHLLIAYEATKNGEYVCTHAKKGGCFEIYFTESFDGGNTWTKAVMIEHPHDTSAMNRRNPQLIYVKATKQAYLTYWIGGTTFTNGKFAYSTRYGAGKFSAEALISVGIVPIDHSVIYTLDAKTKAVKIHLLYVSTDNATDNVMHTSSLDEGKTWRSPKVLASQMHSYPSEAFIEPYAVSNSDLAGDTLFVSFVFSGEAKMMWSHDDGNTWSKVLPTHHGDIVEPRIQLCKMPKTQLPKVHMIAKMPQMTSHHSFAFGTFSLQTHTYKDEEFPFTDMLGSTGYMLDCYVENDEKEVVAAVTETEYHGTLSIFISFNDQLKNVMVNYAD